MHLRLLVFFLFFTLSTTHSNAGCRQRLQAARYALVNIPPRELAISAAAGVCGGLIGDFIGHYFAKTPEERQRYWLVGAVLFSQLVVNIRNAQNVAAR